MPDDTMHENDEQRKQQALYGWMAKFARRLLELGYHVIPLAIAGKEPLEMGWQTKTYTAGQLTDFAYQGHNFGIIYGQSVVPGKTLCALDIDITDPVIVQKVLEVFKFTTPMREGRYPKQLVPVLLDDAEAYNRDYVWYRGNGSGEEDRQAIQVLGRGQRPPAGPKQAAAVGVHPKTRMLYKWSQEGRIFDMRPGDWDYIPSLEEAMAEVTKIMGTFGYVPRARAARVLGEAEAFRGPISAEMVRSETAYTNTIIKSFETMAPGNRGDTAHQLGLRIGVLVRAGHIDLEQTMADILNAMPDNHNAPREFERGVMRSEGQRQRVIFEARQTDWTSMLQGAALKGEPVMTADAPAGTVAAAPDEIELLAEWKETYRHPLIDGACDILYDALRERSGEKATTDESIGRSFMSSLIAAEMASTAELSLKWGARALKLSGINLGRYGHEVKRIESDIAQLQPTEKGWAEYAAFLMGKRGMSPGKSIRGAQHGHKAHSATKEAREAGGGSVEAEIITENAGMRTWDMNANGDAEGESFSNFKFFMSSQLWVWPFVDDWTERVVFRRLVRYDDTRDVVTDAQLARWSNNLPEAVNEIYALARDRQRPWGVSAYTPHHKDIERWLGALVGDGRGRRFNSMVERIKNWPAWDGEERLGTWLARYVGCMPWDKHYAYVCVVGAHFVRNWVQRLENPGHKWDEVLTLVGLQGERKTTLFQVLADIVDPGSYLAGQRLDFDGKTGINRLAEIARGKSLVEMAELTSLGRRDIEHVKAMISQTVDSGRRTYGSTSIDKARQFGLVGTANCSIPHMSGEAVSMELHALEPVRRNLRKRELMEEADKGFLTDASGNRRFHPVLVYAASIDLEALADEAEQLIAEARAQVAADPQRLRLTSEELVLVAAATLEHHTTSGVLDSLAAKLAPVMHIEHVKIRMADIRALLGMGISNGQAGAQLRAAVEHMGFTVYKSNGLMWAYRGDRKLATQAPIIEGSGAVRLAVGVAGGAAGFGPAMAAAQ